MNLYIEEIGDFMVPDAYYKSIFDIDFKKLKDIGIEHLEKECEKEMKYGILYLKFKNNK
jgi:hypothetical protein